MNTFVIAEAGANHNRNFEQALRLIDIAKYKGAEDSGCLGSFKYILSNWNKLDDFTRKQVKLIQISSNLTNIITQLKNGTEKRDSSSIADEILAKYN